MCQFRFKAFGYNFFAMVTKIETLEGITSLIPDTNNLHIIQWDLETPELNLKKVDEALATVQEKHDLSDIYVMSDKIHSFRALCFKLVDFRTLMRILWDTDYVDPTFIRWTQIRGMATIRLIQKKGRPPIEIVEILKSYHAPIPEKFERVVYDTAELIK